MLSAADNETLTRVGKGTPMGELMRRYWLPVMPVDELGPPDSPPQRFRLLGEDLILFRDSNGDVGVFSETCPHRGASLFFGRNEEQGLRCVYHGWKYDVTGQCVDMPNEPDASNFKHKNPRMGLPRSRPRRRRLGLPRRRRAPRTPPARVDARAPGAAPLHARPPQLQLDARTRRRHRHQPRLLPPRQAQPRRLPRRRSLAPRQAPQPRGHPHRLRRRLRRQPRGRPGHHLLARQPVPLPHLRLLPRQPGGTRPRPHLGAPRRLPHDDVERKRGTP